MFYCTTVNTHTHCDKEIAISELPCYIVRVDNSDRLAAEMLTSVQRYQVNFFLAA